MNNRYVNLDVNTDIAMEELIENLSLDQKKYLLEVFVNDLGQEAALIGPVTQTDFELRKALIEIWNSRGMLNPNQISRIKALTVESYIS